MKAVVIKTGGGLAFEEHPDPVAGEADLVVAVEAAGLNGADMAQRYGLYPAPAGWPTDIPGLEMAGRVVEMGATVEDFSIGDRVMGIVGGGGQATMARIEANQALRIPDGVTMATAGSVPETFTTAYDALFSQAGLAMGDRILITGAAGGVGTAAIALAHEAGAEVIASVRNEALHEEILALGAASVTTPDGAAAFGPFDVVLELVGSPTFPTSLSNLAVGGRIVVIGVVGGAHLELNLLELMSKRGRILGSTLRARPSEEKAILAGEIARRVVPRLGRLRIPIAAQLPMSDPEAAYEVFSTAGKFGKVVLVV